MKNILLGLLFTLLTGTSVVAQLTIASDSVYTNVVEGFEVIGHNTFTNTSSASSTFQWDANVLEMTEGWQLSVCDANLCYGAGTITQQIELGSNVASNLDLHVFLNGIYSGYALVEMTVHDINNPSATVSAVYEFGNTSTRTLEYFDTSIAVYPNPAPDYIKVIDPNGSTHTAALYTTSGVLVQTYSLLDNKTLDLQGLENSLYVLHIFNKDNNIVSVKSFAKQ